MVAKKSVNIPTAERSEIMKKARNLFLKTALTKHPDEKFLTNITKRVFLESLEKLRPLVDSGHIKYVSHINIDELSYNISNLRFPEGYAIRSLISRSNLNNAKLLGFFSTLENIEASEINIPVEFITDRKIPFVAEEYSNSNRGTIDLSDEVKEEITAFNNKMEEVYTELESQLELLMSTINNCRTTKAFEEALPNLVNLYPQSIVRKLEEKNNKDVAKTEEEQKLDSAMTTIATAALLGD